MKKKYLTRGSQKNMLRLLMGGQEKSGNVSSPFGPMKVGLITTQDHLIKKGNQDRQLSVLLNSLENKIQDLSIKSYGVLSTYLSDILLPAKRTDSIYETNITRNMVE
jgi:hypothetical protein